MKIKSRNLLTVILAILCAVAVAIGVGFALPKNEINAKAATITAEVTNCSAGTMTGVSWSSAGNTVNIYENASRLASSSGSVTFGVVLKNVPAGTFQIRLKFNVSAQRGASTTGTSTVTAACGGASITTNTTGSNTSTTQYQTITGTGLDITWNGTFIFTAQAQLATSAHHQLNASVTVSVELKDIDIPTCVGSNEDTYSGMPISFGINYDSGIIEPFNVTGTDFNGNSISVSLSDINSATGIFSPTIAGNYTVTFKLKSTTIGAGAKWSDGTTDDKSLTFKIERKTISVPDIISSQKSQTYDPNGCTFDPDTNYDSTKMSVDTLALSSGITWNGTQFEATDVGTYNVKFKLTDANYVWNINGSDVSECTQTVAITNVGLTVPKITTDKQTYNGSALTFTLDTNFDSTKMKMDSVTPDNSANVVTGAGGLGLTDTSNTFQATNAGKYTVNISLRDTANYQWSDGTTGTKTATFEIEKKDLVTGITCNTMAAGSPRWGQGTNGVQMTVKLDKVYNEYPALTFYYDNNPANTLSIASSTDTEIVVDLPATIPVGIYNFNIAMDSAADTGYNKNYKVDTLYSSYAFTVTNTESAIAYYGGNEINSQINIAYDGNTHLAKADIEIKGVVNGTSVTDFTVTYYKGTSVVAGNELATGELPTDAGDYCVKITLGTAAADIFTLANDEFVLTISPKEITAPVLADGTNLVFNGLTQDVSDSLRYDKNIIEIVTSYSVLAGYHADTYSVYFKIKDAYKGNYVFVLPTSTQSTTKQLVKGKGLADGQVSYSVTLSDNDKSAQLDWNIQKYVYDTTTSSAWNFTKEGATLSFKGVPASIVALTTGPSPTLVFDINYYDQNYSALSEVTLNGGSKFYVAASLANCADRDDIVFKNQTYDNVVGRDISPHASYTVPKNSGLTTFFNSVKEFMTKTALGLPVWAWFLIALVLLILLIIIIVVAAKRRKTKEEKEEIKARKEEEKQRREEERQRLEEERRRKEEEREEEKRRREEERAEEKRRREEQLAYEREMAKAKQEAELEKIKAQAAANAGMAGMATMAMAQPVQQAMPAPVQQPVQQVVDNTNNELLKEMTRQMAEMRAENKATQAQLQEMKNTQQQQPQPMQMPLYQQPMMQQYPMYQQMPMGMGMPGYGDPTLARLEAQINAMQIEQRARYEAEQRAELAAMRAEQHVDRDSRHSVDLAAMREHYSGNMGYSNHSVPQLGYGQQQPNMDMMGALVAATLKNMANGEVAVTAVPELPQKSEQSETITAKYPPDAVVTTTTTVDTTKNGAIRRDENFDIDGFYDPLD